MFATRALEAHFSPVSRARRVPDCTCVTRNSVCVLGCPAGAEPAGEGRPEAQHLRGLAQLLGPREPRSGDEVRGYVLATHSRLELRNPTITGTQR